MTDKSTNGLAEERTDLAEDRTLMAVERTMASWTSASFAAIGVGLGLRALFGKVEPAWIPRLVASLFLVLAIVMVISAERRMCHAITKLSSHEVVPPSRNGLRISAYGVAGGATILIAAIWLLYV